MNNANSNYAVIHFLSTLQARWVPVGCLQIWETILTSALPLYENACGSDNGFFPPVRFAPQMNCETLHAFQFSDTSEAPTVPRILVQNGTQSLSNKTAFHGALQINWVWLIGCFFSLSLSPRMHFIHSFHTYRADWQAVLSSADPNLSQRSGVQKASQ